MLASISVAALDEVGSDSRIRTFVYGKNDVYKVTTSFGYQTTIELEEDEKIRTISLGNSSSFKITPQKNRIFVKTLQGGQLTNMVVITTKRTYQFELSSIIDSIEEIMYVVRFYHPDTFSDSVGISSPSAPSANYNPNQSMLVPEVNLGGGGAAQMGGGMTPPGMGGQQYGMQQALDFSPPNSMVFNSPVSGSLNYNYSLTGPDALSPSEVFDDGIRTYVKFNTNSQPVFRNVSPNGDLLPVNFTKQGQYYVIDGVSPKMTVYFGSEHICIYNESMNGNII